MDVAREQALRSVSRFWPGGLGGNLLGAADLAIGSGGGMGGFFLAGGKGSKVLGVLKKKTRRRKIAEAGHLLKVDQA